MRNGDELEDVRLLRSTGKNTAKTEISLAPLVLIASRWARTLILILLSINCSTAHEGEKIYRTGLEASKGWFAISPDGYLIVFETGLVAHGLRLLDLRTRKISFIPEQAGRIYRSPSWSPDGKQVAVVSATVQGNREVVGDRQIVLLDKGTWLPRIISPNEGFKTSPFFSEDGKTIYYFNGKKRESGKTPASRYDLHAVDLVSLQETQLTHEEFYQACDGDEKGRNVLFSATSKTTDAFGKKTRNALFLYDKAGGGISQIQVDQSSGIFDFSCPRRDMAGNLYFKASKARPDGGNYLSYLIRSSPDGRAIEYLAQMPINLGFDIAQNTGAIFALGTDGEELIFQRLTAQAVH